MERGSNPLVLGSRATGLAVAVVALWVCSVGRAQAASTYKLCSAGAGKPVLSPGKSGRCMPRQKAIVLPSRAALRTLNSQVKTLKSQNRNLSGRVGTLEGWVGALRSTLAGVTRSGSTLRFTGMNLQVLSGSGATDGTVNGLGNLIIGYNENPNGANSQTGSHNLVIGSYQTFTSYGGIIAGEFNTLSGPFSTVLANNNTASGSFSSVTGGTDNTASGETTSIIGGRVNTASGPVSSVTGGAGNTASGEGSSARGGANISVTADFGYAP